MPETHDTDHDKRTTDQKKKAGMDEQADIIELSQIAIGTSQEDDAIIELTEELIGEAMNGITGVTHEDFSEEEHILDLSPDSKDESAPFGMPEIPARNNKVSADSGFSGAVDIEAEDVEEHLTKELDDYFGTEQDGPPKPASAFRDGSDDISRINGAVPEDNELLAALEVMIRNKYGDRIHHMLVAAIDKIVFEEFERIKKNIVALIKS